MIKSFLHFDLRSYPDPHFFPAGSAFFSSRIRIREKKCRILNPVNRSKFDDDLKWVKTPLRKHFLHYRQGFLSDIFPTKCSIQKFNFLTLFLPWSIPPPRSWGRGWSRQADRAVTEAQGHGRAEGRAYSARPRTRAARVDRAGCSRSSSAAAPRAARRRSGRRGGYRILDLELSNSWSWLLASRPLTIGRILDSWSHL